MNDFERGIYADMESVERVLLYMGKVSEAIEFQTILTSEDMKLMKRFIEEECKKP